MGKRQSLWQELLGNLDSCMQINETKTHPHTMCKNKLKMAESLNIRQDTIKLLEEKLGKTFSYKCFLRSVPQSNRNKSKNKPMAPNQTDKILHSKRNQKEKKRQLTEWEKIVSNDATDKGLISKIYKKLKQLNSKEVNNPIERWAKDLNLHFSKEDI